MIGGLDIGTSGCKISVYNREAELLDCFYIEYAADYCGDCHEIHFDEIKNGVFSLLKKAAEKYSFSAIGVTSFGETFAMLDEEDRILAPSMLYTDKRGTEETEELCRQLGKEWLTLLSGVKPHSMYSVGKMIWQKKNNPHLFDACKRILLAQDFIVYTLTGVAQIDYSLAARTAAFDVEKKDWIKEVFEATGIDMGLMSKPVPCGTVAGPIKQEIKELLSMNGDPIVVSGCHDQVAGMIGAGILKTGRAMDGAGTVECIPVLLREKPTDLAFYEGGYSVVPYPDEQYACYAFSFTGGATLKWFRNNFADREWKEAEEAGKNIYSELEKKVNPAPTDILVLPHFAGAATPYMDVDSKAAFVGITLDTTKYDLYKALMEGVAYEMLLNFNTLKELTGEIEEIRATGGGALSDVWLQIKADVLNREIIAFSCHEIGGAGTAAIAGLAAGCFSNLESIVSKMASVRKTFSPDKQRVKEYADLYKKYANLYRATKEL